MASSDDEEATISLLSLALVALLSFFIIRYFVSLRSSDDTSSSTASRRRGQRFTPAQVEQLAQMFPQLNRRDIMWDLQRNGGSVAATSERVLGGRGLERAPPSFQPVMPASTNAAVTPVSVIPRAPEPDLISRYHLQSRISTKGKEKEEPSPAAGWAANKEKRQEMLRRRRDEMILAARRKMQERDQEGAAAS